MHTHMCLETQEMRDVNFLGLNIYCDACVFFWGHYVVHLSLLGCVATHASFYGTYILKIMGWVYDLPYLDLGLG